MSLYTVEQIELIRRLRQTGITIEQISEVGVEAGGIFECVIG